MAGVGWSALEAGLQNDWIWSALHGRGRGFIIAGSDLIDQEGSQPGFGVICPQGDGQGVDLPAPEIIPEANPEGLFGALQVSCGGAAVCARVL